MFIYQRVCLIIPMHWTVLNSTTLTVRVFFRWSLANRTSPTLETFPALNSQVLQGDRRVGVSRIVQVLSSFFGRHRMSLRFTWNDSIFGITLFYLPFYPFSPHQKHPKTSSFIIHHSSSPSPPSHRHWCGGIGGTDAGGGQAAAATGSRGTSRGAAGGLRGLRRGVAPGGAAGDAGHCRGGTGAGLRGLCPGTPGTPGTPGILKTAYGYLKQKKP